VTKELVVLNVNTIVEIEAEMVLLRSQEKTGVASVLAQEKMSADAARDEKVKVQYTHYLRRGAQEMIKNMHEAKVSS
jgi:hypothetical protein